MKIVVLAGGNSSEREVSMLSGSQISNALIRRGHEVLLIDVSIGIDSNNFNQAYKHYKQEYYSYKILNTIPSLDNLIEMNYIGDNIIEICKSADIVFIALHGGIGENGKLQALFDLYRIKYTGSGYKSSMICMDKILTKQIIEMNGINTPRWEEISSLESTISLSYPIVLKPNGEGSSIGVEIIENPDRFYVALNNTLKYSGTCLVEEKVVGREFSVGILGDNVLPIIEIIPNEGFYDYNNKYQEGATTEIVPADLDEELTNRIKDLSKHIHDILGMEVYSRIDFIVDKYDNVFFIEANSLPGMTPLSLLPQEALADGMDYDALCEKIVAESLRKYI